MLINSPASEIKATVASK